MLGDQTDDSTEAKSWNIWKDFQVVQDLNRVVYLIFL